MMNHKQFQAWLSQVDELSTAQRREAEAVLSGGSQASASLAAVEAGVGEDRRCPHSGTPGAVSRGKARKRGLSSEQVPVLAAADRSGMTVSAVLPAVNADALRDVIEPAVDDDIVLVSDGHRAYPPCVAAMGVRHEALNLSGGERVRNAIHIQTVNSRHGLLKCFLRRYRTAGSRPGISTTACDGFSRSNWTTPRLARASPTPSTGHAYDL